jgi:hypothetical protein
MFKHLIKELKERKHIITIFAVKKDILTDLLDADNIKYVNNYPTRRKNNKLSMIKSLVIQDYGLLKHCLKNRPDIMLGTSPEICHIGFLLNIPSFSFGEDDVALAPLNFWLSFPFTRGIISPVVRNVGRWEYKKISYPGYQKLAYLHPKRFTPDKTLVQKYIDFSKPYYLIRLSSLDAHHDDNIKGFNAYILRKVINLLNDKGNIFISSESTLPNEFSNYKLNANINVIHHIMYYADIYIGDSQSMAVEAAVLGVPSIRFSDFAGKISVLEDLEKNYGLTYGYKTSDSDKLLHKLQQFLENGNLRSEWQNRRKIMLNDKIDVTSFWLWFIDKYPDSYKALRIDPNYWEKVDYL